MSVSCPPGHILTVEADRHELRPWHQFDGEQTLSFTNSDQAVAAYRAELDRAVLSRFSSDFPLGFELSGGLDSSTLVCYAARHLPEEER
ncbi:MAG: hypothetical protein D3909_18655 [Candidatus Electrothrix sp. ATG1]|nr:hypothetical protein [Candidatus Electrothrix sp. ATG1]